MENEREMCRPCGGAAFVRLRNNLFNVETVKSLRLDGSSVCVFMAGGLDARVEYESDADARRVFKAVARLLVAPPCGGGPVLRGDDAAALSAGAELRGGILSRLCGKLGGRE